MSHDLSLRNATWLAKRTSQRNKDHVIIDCFALTCPGCPNSQLFLLYISTTISEKKNITQKKMTNPTKQVDCIASKLWDKCMSETNFGKQWLHRLSQTATLQCIFKLLYLGLSALMCDVIRECKKINLAISLKTPGFTVKIMPPLNSGYPITLVKQNLLQSNNVEVWHSLPL